MTASPEKPREAGNKEQLASDNESVDSGSLRDVSEARANRFIRREGDIHIERSGESSARSIDDFERDEMIAAIREVFSHNSDLDRNYAIREVARALEFNRTGSRIADAIDSALIAAAKREVIQNNRGYLSLWSRNINDYNRDELIDTLLSVMGVVWWARNEAIIAAARHLGFKRTGRLIRDAFKSAINIAIRRGLVERNGGFIRRLSNRT